MKYIKKFESQENVILKIELAKPIVNLINKVDPSCEYSFLAGTYGNDGGVWIISKKTNSILITIDGCLFDESKIQISVFSKLPEKLNEFLQEIFKSQNTFDIFYVKIKNLKEYINKLNWKNYKNFKINKEAEKYNL